MATIKGSNFEGVRSLRLVPIPSGETSQDAVNYELELWKHDGGVILNRIYSVENWQSRHTAIWLIARAFIESSKLMHLKTPIDLWNSGHGDHAYFYKGSDWLRIVLWGIEKQDKICVEFFIQERSDSDIMRRFFLQTSSLESVQFGTDLEQEIISVSPRWWSEHKGQ